MNDDNQVGAERFVFRADPWTATTEWFNIVFVLLGALLLGAGSWVTWAVAIRGSVFLAVYSGVVAVLGLALVLLQVWGMYTVTIEGDSQKIVYRVSFQKVLVEWKAVRSVQIENWKKQVTFQTDGGVRRIHWFGIAPLQRETIHAAIREIAAQRGVRCN